MHAPATVLMVDDDPSHLRIYSWILETAGCEVVTALVHAQDVDLPSGRRFALIVLDYRFAGSLSPAGVARKIQEAFPNVPIMILSDSFGMPLDMEPYATCFVRKGEPEKLVAAVKEMLSQPENTHWSGSAEPPPHSGSER